MQWILPDVRGLCLIQAVVVAQRVVVQARHRVLRQVLAQVHQVPHLVRRLVRVLRQVLAQVRRAPHRAVVLRAQARPQALRQVQVRHQVHQALVRAPPQVVAVARRQAPRVVVALARQVLALRLVHPLLARALQVVPRAVRQVAVRPQAQAVALVLVRHLLRAHQVVARPQVRVVLHRVRVQVHLRPQVQVALAVVHRVVVDVNS